MCTCDYDFNGEDVTDLTIKCGDRIEIIGNKLFLSVVSLLLL